MDQPEIDPMELLAEITCPDERAKTAREFGLWRDEHSALATSGCGPNAAINGGIFNRDDPPPKPRGGRKRRVSRKSVRHCCPRCGLVYA
jgi:hypothetical protein